MTAITPAAAALRVIGRLDPPAFEPAITPAQFRAALRTERIILMHQQMVAEKEAADCSRQIAVINEQLRLIAAAQAEGQQPAGVAAKICPVFKTITGSAG